MKPTISIITSLYQSYPYLDVFFINLKQQKIIDQCELILLNNEPTLGEIEKIHGYINDIQIKITHIIVNPKESLAASWNRGITIAKGDFICLWNVDDQRERDSLLNQLQVMIENPDICVSYGNFLEIQDTNTNLGVQHITPEFSKKLFQKRFACGGAFLFFRSNIFNKFGYFDEQLTIASDYDFILRLINLGGKLKKTEGILGYFLNNRSGLSTIYTKNTLFLEQNIIHQRYGNPEKIKWGFKNAMLRYSTNDLLYLDKRIPLKDFGIDVEKNKKKSVIQWLSYLIRNIARQILFAFGGWDYALHLRDRILKHKK
jgi:GT2 family glycosyltransferase